MRVLIIRTGEKILLLLLFLQGLIDWLNDWILFVFLFSFFFFCFIWVVGFEHNLNFEVILAFKGEWWMVPSSGFWVLLSLPWGDVSTGNGFTAGIWSSLSEMEKTDFISGLTNSEISLNPTLMPHVYLDLHQIYLDSSWVHTPSLYKSNPLSPICFSKSKFILENQYCVCHLEAQKSDLIFIKKQQHWRFSWCIYIIPRHL